MKIPALTGARDRFILLSGGVHPTAVVLIMLIGNLGSRKSVKLQVLFISANPANTEPLQLINECNNIEEKIRAARYANRFNFKQWHQASLSKLQKHIIDTTPQILHFSGHGLEEGSLVFEDIHGQPEEARIDAIANLFRVLNSRKSISEEQKVKVILLNACFSEKLADAICKNIDCVIGMKNAVRDDAAIVFAESFYQALASGESVLDAFELGKNQVELLNIPGQDTPKLKVRDTVDASAIFLAKYPKVFKNNNNGSNNRKKSLSRIKPIILEQPQTYLDIPDYVTVLLLAANPAGTAGLQLDKEFNSIRLGIANSVFRDKFHLEKAYSVSLSTFHEDLLRTDAQIVHFAGHGTEDGDPAFENEDGGVQAVPMELIANAFRIKNTDPSLPPTKRIRCVILNSMNSAKKAGTIAKYVDCVIGIDYPPTDEHAILFAKAFYSILANGATIQQAFELASNQLRMKSLDASYKLVCRKGIDPATIALVEKINEPKSTLGRFKMGNNDSELSQDNIYMLKKQYDIHKKNLSYYEIEAAKYGGIGVPVRLINDIQEEKKKLQELTKKLQHIKLDD